MRYKEFNRNNVLEKCLDIFWKQSFHGTSLNEIVKATNVNRFSLYNEFTNKRGILDAALKLYKERYSRLYFLVKPGVQDLKSSLQQFYRNFLQTKLKHPPGCFIIYTATELSDDDKQMTLYLTEYLAEVKDSLRNILAQYSNDQGDQNVFLEQLTGLFCNAMCFCYIQSEAQRSDYINLNLNLFLK